MVSDAPNCEGLEEVHWKSDARPLAVVEHPICLSGIVADRRESVTGIHYSVRTAKGALSSVSGSALLGVQDLLLEIG